MGEVYLDAEVSLWVEGSGKVYPFGVGQDVSFKGVQWKYWFEDGFADVELEG